jgi:hypothetical protein
MQIMAKHMKPGFSLELNQVIEWIMLLRRPSHRNRYRLRREPPDAGALHPGQATFIELTLVASDTARYQRFSGVVKPPWRNLELYGLCLNPMGA